jgi:hypothetical protein
MPVLHGVDTSNNQGRAVVGIGPDVVAAGATGWWHKATQGSGYKDPYWPACRANAEAVGLVHRGPYHWLTPGSAVADQFRNFHDHVGDLHPGEVIQLDIEDPAGLPDAKVIECIELWEGAYPGRVLHYMARWYGRNGDGVHTPVSYLVDRMLARFGTAFRWWLPWYTTTFPGGLPTTPIVWQWAGGAGGVLIPTVGRIDSNQIIDLRRLDAASGYSPDLHLPLPPSPEVDMETIIFDSVDATGTRWAYAKFAGELDVHGVCRTIEWIDGGTEAKYLALGVRKINRGPGGYLDFRLEGDIPFGDPLYTWAATDFRRVSPVGSPGPQGAQGPTGPKGDPGPALKGVFPATVTIS